MIELNYAKIDLDEDIPCYKFNKHSQMIDFIDKNCYQRDKIVWLLAKDESKDVFISESQLSIQDFLTKKTAWQSTGVYFLFEYPSYEEAYKVALDMMEIHELCYSSETKDSPYWKKSVPEFMDNL